MRRRLGLAFVLLAGVVLTTVVFRRPWFQGNFGVVEPNRVYRSAQPGPEFASTIAATKLGSVLNLRGGSLADPWYDHEVRVTRALGVDFYDFPMSATRRPSRRELLVVLDTLSRCRYPLLIHCKSGSDRTGLVSALYLLAERGVPPEAAAGSFRLAYGHVPLFGTQHLHEPLDEYAAWLQARGLPHTPDRFRRWVETEYQSDEPVVAFQPLPKGPRLPADERARASTRRR